MATPKELQDQVIAKAVKDADFRAELERNPKEVFTRETGLTLPDELAVKVVSEEPSTLYLILPPEGEELPEDELAAVAGGVTPDGGVFSAKGGLKPGLGGPLMGSCHSYLCCDGTLDVTG